MCRAGCSGETSCRWKLTIEQTKRAIRKTGHCKMLLPAIPTTDISKQSFAAPTCGEVHVHISMTKEWHQSTSRRCKMTPMDSGSGGIWDRVTRARSEQRSLIRVGRHSRMSGWKCSSGSVSWSSRDERKGGWSSIGSRNRVNKSLQCVWSTYTPDLILMMKALHNTFNTMGL
jgi:hypothetical protein